MDFLKVYSFKNSLKNIVKEVYRVDLSTDELKELFIKNNLTKDWKNIIISYDLVLTKWADCFNTTIAMMNLKVWNNWLQIDAVTWDPYLSNEAVWTTTESVFGYSERKWDKTYNTPADTPEGAPADATSWWWTKVWGDDSVVGF